MSHDALRAGFYPEEAPDVTLLNECVKAYYVDTESYDQRICRFRLPDGTAQPVSVDERQQSNIYARTKCREYAAKARVSEHVFREACRRFSLTPEWNQLRVDLANAPRSLR